MLRKIIILAYSLCVCAFTAYVLNKLRQSDPRLKQLCRSNIGPRFHVHLVYAGLNENRNSQSSEAIRPEKFVVIFNGCPCVSVCHQFFSVQRFSNSFNNKIPKMSIEMIISRKRVNGFRSIWVLGGFLSLWSRIVESDLQKFNIHVEKSRKRFDFYWKWSP